MALTDKLTAIADAIRAKTGDTAKLTLDAMPGAIDGITTETPLYLKPAEYPDYVRTEAERVAAEARKVISSESLVSICLSDSHYPASENTRLSGLHAMMGIKALTYLLPVDFIAHLGDVGFEGDHSTETTTDRLETNLVEMLGYIRESAGDSIPLFVAIGNHDPGDYITKDDDTDMIGGEYLYRNFTALSASDDTVFSGEATGGYCYRDFTDKKIRVFMLNSAENIIIGGYDNDSGCSATQLAWFASKLQELNTKTDAASWGIVVLCHYPADYGAARPLSNVIAAYVNGTSITLNGTAYNFSGKNAARFLVQHHGHVHNFLVSKLYTGSTPTQYDAWRVGIPNTQDSRENYYGEFSGIQYSEDVSQTKTPGTAKDTSFVVNVINPSEDKVYSFCYGAGYDRVVGIAKTVYYSISKSLSNATLSNSTTSVEAGTAYTATITPTSGYELDTVKVTMGGTDITSTAYANGVVTIAEVTGNVVITATAVKPVNYTNLVRTSINTDGSAYNGTGYKDNTRIGSGGTETSYTGYAATGYFRLPADGNAYTLRLGGEGITFTDYGCQVCVYDASFTKLSSSLNYGAVGQTNYGTWITTEDTCFTLVVNPESQWGRAGEAIYMRLSAKGKGENLIVTINEPIE